MSRFDNPSSDHKTLFKRSKYARWSIKTEAYAVPNMEPYACHLRCPYKSEVSISWFSSDDVGGDPHPMCYGCGVKVPDYIQTLVHLYQGH